MKINTMILIILITISIISQSVFAVYTPPASNDIDFELDSGYTAPTYSNINFELDRLLSDTTVPTYSQNSTNSTLAGTDILHTLKWADDTELDGYIFSFCNGTRSGGSWCYQETANISTACGGLSTGTYNCTGTWSGVYGCNLSYDGDWDTYGLGALQSNLSINYSKPDGAISGKWKVKDGDSGVTVNLTITDACWSQDIIQLKIDSENHQSHTYSSCWNGSDWHELRDDGGTLNAKVWEEGMWWNISDWVFVNDSYVAMIGTLNWSNVTKSVNNSVGSTIKWQVYANDSSNNWNSSTIYEYITTSAAGDTCDCPASGTNWGWDFADNCTISTNCDIGTGKVYVLNTNVGIWTINAVVTGSKDSTLNGTTGQYITGTGHLNLTVG